MLGWQTKSIMVCHGIFCCGQFPVFFKILPALVESWKFNIFSGKIIAWGEILNFKIIQNFAGRILNFKISTTKSWIFKILHLSVALVSRHRNSTAC